MLALTEEYQEEEGETVFQEKENSDMFETSNGVPAIGPWWEAAQMCVTAPVQVPMSCSQYPEERKSM